MAIFTKTSLKFYHFKNHEGRLSEKQLDTDRDEVKTLRFLKDFNKRLSKNAFFSYQKFLRNVMENFTSKDGNGVTR